MRRLAAKLRGLRGRDAGPATVVDVVLADPVRQLDRVDAEIDGGLLGLLASTHERHSTSTKLRRIGTWQEHEPFGSGHHLGLDPPMKLGVAGAS